MGFSDALLSWILIQIKRMHSLINHFTVACLVAWSLNESEAGGDIVLVETFFTFLLLMMLFSIAN